MDKDPGSPLSPDPYPGILSERSDITELEKLKVGHTSSSSAKPRKRERPTTRITVAPESFRQKVIELSGQRNDLLPFISHCSLLPCDYEFAEQELVSLWLAQGFSRALAELEKQDKVFDSLVFHEVIVPSRYDPCVDFSHQKTRTLLYKANHSKISFSEPEYATVLDGNLDSVPDNVKHKSIDSKSIRHVDFEPLKRFQDLRTLLVIPKPGFYVEEVPRDVFLSLKQLRSLSFSRSLLSELPSSIGNLKSLGYLDLSYTPIKRLPDLIVSLRNLQTLRLRGCVELVGLPKGTGELANLRHLDLDVIGQLRSMPPAMGNLTNLQTLSAFLVGNEDRCRIVELKNMVNLKGTFCISRIENVSSVEEALEVDLSSKKFLSSLQLRWTASGEDDASKIKEEQILQYLRPPLGLEELTLVCYGGFVLPTWVADPSYRHLVDLTLFNCMNCQFLLAIGKLPSLQVLHIKEMNNLERTDEQFCRDGEGQQSHAFPSLKELTIEVMPAMEEWTGVQNGDFPSLLKLKVEHCPKLISLPLLPCLYSLVHLEVLYCPNISSLPDGEVATSLEYLLIKDCSELAKTCNKVEGKDWSKIAHVPNIFIDDEEISC